jgi:hypothetical protein
LAVPYYPTAPEREKRNIGYCPVTLCTIIRSIYGHESGFVEVPNNIRLKEFLKKKAALNNFFLVQCQYCPSYLPGPVRVGGHIGIPETNLVQEKRMNETKHT